MMWKIANLRQWPRIVAHNHNIIDEMHNAHMWGVYCVERENTLKQVYDGELLASRGDTDMVRRKDRWGGKGRGVGDVESGDAEISEGGMKWDTSIVDWIKFKLSYLTFFKVGRVGRFWSRSRF